MKDATFTIEFITHCLASGKIENAHDEFRKDSEGNLVWQQSWWYSALTQAINLSSIRGVRPADLNINPIVEAETELFKRKYGADKFRTHEAILPGTRVTFEAVVADHITESVLENILERAGKYVGLSPYGFNLGYGKFNTIEVNVAPSIPEPGKVQENGKKNNEAEEARED
jgi:hypothetical protein